MLKLGKPQDKSERIGLHPPEFLEAKELERGEGPIQNLQLSGAKRLVEYIYPQAVEHLWPHLDFTGLPRKPGISLAKLH